jgi:polyisoprenoid-binding protein YceI
MGPSQPLHRLLAGLLAALLLSSAATVRAQSASDASLRTAVVDSAQSRIDYFGSAVAHDWRGTSRRLSGRVLVDAEAPARSRVRLSVPVASFDSGNRRRDRKMRETLNAAEHPAVRFRTDSVRVDAWGRTRDGHAGRWTVYGPLSFHGRTRPIEATVRVRVTDDSLVAGTSFPISLTRFEVDRPRLLFVPIDDTIRVEAAVRAGIVPSAPADSTQSR